MTHRKNSKPDEIKRKLVSMPQSLLDQLQEMAEKNERSAEAEIRFAIRQHIDRELEEAA